MKVKTSELEGDALDWAVAKADGYDVGWLNRQLTNPNPRTRAIPAFSTDGAQGILIIEREKIWLKFPFMTKGDVEAIHGKFGFPNVVNSSGPTAQIAAMRCFVTSKLGPEVEVPDELVDGAKTGSQPPRERG